MGLSDGRKSFRIGLAVLIQYRSVTDTQPATQPPSHVAVAITLNAQASSLKTRPGLVALYDIGPGNGAGPFLQPRSPHGAIRWLRMVVELMTKICWIHINNEKTLIITIVALSWHDDILTKNC